MAWYRADGGGSGGGGLNAIDCNIMIIDLGGGQGIDAVDFDIRSVNAEETPTEENR